MQQKIAVIVQRYGWEINGGAEYHARLISEKLAIHFEVEVFTTTALDYITWEPHFPAGAEMVNGIAVSRFHVKKPRNPGRFGEIQMLVFEKEHAIQDELSWLEEEGPVVPDLLSTLKHRQDEFSFMLFFSYRYYHSFHGVGLFPRKSILVPTAEHDAVIHLQLFKNFFQKPAAIIYNSQEEKELINLVSGNDHVPSDVIGVGSEIPETFDLAGALRRHSVPEPYFLYIGRLDENKGVPQLFDFFLRFATEAEKKLSLVLVGRSVIPIPQHPLIRHLGFLPDQDKFDLLKGAQFLVIPSQYESLSMVCLEAWALKKPVLVNGHTAVLKGQCRRSHAGLWYESYEEFHEAMLLLQDDSRVREELGANGQSYFTANYSWGEIMRKYLNLFERLSGAGGA